MSEKKSYIPPLFRGKIIGTAKYATGHLNEKHQICDIRDSVNYEINIDTLSIRVGRRNLFMSLDIETGIGGDKISKNEVLVWNSDMMNCSVLSLKADGSINDYEIDLDNNDFDKIEVVGIQQ